MLGLTLMGPMRTLPNVNNYRLRASVENQRLCIESSSFSRQGAHRAEDHPVAFFGIAKIRTGRGRNGESFLIPHVVDSERLTESPERVEIADATDDSQAILPRLNPLAILFGKSEVGNIGKPWGHRDSGNVLLFRIKPLKFRYTLFNHLAGFWVHCPRFYYGVLGGGRSIVSEVERQLVRVVLSIKVRDLSVWQSEIHGCSLSTPAQFILPQREEHEQSSEYSYEEIPPRLSGWPFQPTLHDIFLVLLTLGWVGLLFWASVLLTDREDGRGGALIVVGWLVMWLWGSMLLGMIHMTGRCFRLGETRSATALAVNPSHRPIAVEIQEPHEIPKFGDPTVRAAIYVGKSHADHEDWNATGKAHVLPLGRRNSEIESKDRRGRFAPAKDWLREVKQIATYNFGFPTKDRQCPYEHAFRCVDQAHSEVFNDSNPLASIPENEAKTDIDMSGVGLWNDITGKQGRAYASKSALRAGVLEPLQFQFLRFYEYVGTLGIERKLGNLGGLFSSLGLGICGNGVRLGRDYICPRDFSSGLGRRVQVASYRNQLVCELRQVNSRDCSDQREQNLKDCSDAAPESDPIKFLQLFVLAVLLDFGGGIVCYWGLNGWFG